jgi:hypothetical protein
VVDHTAQGLPVVITSTAFSPEWLQEDRSRKLREALYTAAVSEKLIPSEVDRLDKLLEKARNPTEKEAREYQIEYVRRHLTRASRLAQDRLDHLSSITTQSAADDENEFCKNDKVYWFKYYGWGYDPRARSPLSIVPFELFPKQVELIEWLDNIVFEQRTSGAIEKARDEGATETIVRWGIHNWNYREGFDMLLSSRTEDEVDTKKKQGTLFERSRFQIRLLPPWMLPRTFDVEKDMLADKLIANPQNGNALVGQAPVENMGRGDRVTCAMFDEFAFWRFAGYPQFRSMSQTTDSIIMPSSVAGKLNQYADITHDGVTPKFEMDWRDNPTKDKRWYNALPYGYISPKMDSTTIAQEVDRNYEASQPGKVWTFEEPYLFITYDEFLKPFKLHAKAFTEGIIPVDWRVTETEDFGKSEDHEWAVLIGAQPREIYPLHDTHFIFLAQNYEPTGIAIEEAVRKRRELEIELGIRGKGREFRNKPKARWHSHEQANLRKVLLQKYGETWIPWDTSYERGIATIEDWFTVIDKDKPNPFRSSLMGRTRIVFVAPNDEYQMAYNDRLKQWFVTISQSERGFYTLRRQLSAYHYPRSELGKARKDMKPEKTFDDVIDCLRGYAVNWNRRPEELTYDETVEANMPEAYKMENMLAKHPDRKGLTDMQQLARRLMEQEIREKLKMPHQLPDWLQDAERREDSELTDGW